MYKMSITKEYCIKEFVFEDADAIMERYIHFLEYVTMGGGHTMQHKDDVS